MKNLIFALFTILLITGCNSVKITTLKEIQGTYKRHNSSQKIEFKSDGTFILYNALPYCGVFMEQSEIASQGKWALKSNDVLELISEDHYLKQNGYEYELKKENKLSQDSLYIKIKFPKYYNIPDAKMCFLFVNIEKEYFIETEKDTLIIPKANFLSSKKYNSINLNPIRIIFSIRPNIEWRATYRSRTWFNIFQEDIDTDQTNYLTITLPYFDVYFFDFETVKDLIYIKNDKSLYWRGSVWKKKE